MSDGELFNRDGAVALHSQISDWIRSHISSGEWPTNYRLRTEPELAEELGVSRGTLRRALTTLIGEGVLRQVQGRGTFVTSTVLEPAIAQKLSTLSEDFASQGVEVATEVLERSVVAAPRPVASLLDIAGNQRVLRLTRRRTTEKGVVALLKNYVRADLTPGIELIDFTEQSLFGVLESVFGLRIGSGRRTFTAVAASGEVSTALELEPGMPVQYMEQVTYLADGSPIEYSDVWINSSLLRVTSMLARR